jgi:PKD repeat protein
MQRFAPLANMDGFSFESPETWLVTDGYPALAWESVTELTVDTVEATSPTVARDVSGTITVTAKESGTDAGEGVTVEVLSNDSLDGFDTGDTAVTDTSGQVTFTFDEPDHGTYQPTFAWADDTSVSSTPTVTVQDSTPPAASAGPETTIDEGQSVSFDGTGSMDNVGIVSYDWDFDDDGTTATGQTTSHTFDSPGTYTVELTVTDAAGNTDTDTVEVTVKSTGSDGGGSGGSSGSTDTGGDQSTADDSSVGTETVVSGTQSDDDGVLFIVNASDDDGPITLDLSETDADGTDGEDESGGNDDSEGEDENTVSVDSLSITPTESGSREFDISVREWDANIDTSERATESDDTGTDTTDVSDPQGATDGDRAHTDPRTFLIETGLSPLGYVEVTHTNPDSDIDSVTFRFRIRKDALNESDVDPSGVALYRNGTDGWTRLPTDEIGENSTHYVFEGTSPGLSLFTIASAQPALDQTLTEPTPPEQETTQQTTVATDNSSQTASANGTRETTTDASGPGFGVLVLIGAFLIVIVFFRRRS